METDIRGAFEAGMLSYLVLSGSTQFEDVADYVYQPTRILQSVAELTEEVKSGRESNAPFDSVMPANGFRFSKAGLRHQTDIFALHKPRPRPAMTK
jgi:NagD protein